METAIGALSSLLKGVLTADVMTGGAIHRTVGRNIGKFGGKLGKWGLDKISPNKRNNMINKAEQGAEYVEKAFGKDSEITKNANNFVKELKGENVDWRGWWNENETKPNNIIMSNYQYDMTPYAKNLGGTNYKRYIPRKRSPLRVDLKRMRNKVKNKKKLITKFRSKY